MKLILENWRKYLSEEESNLFANIRAKRARGEEPAKKGDKDYPDEKSWKKATKPTKKPSVTKTDAQVKKATKKESIEEYYEVDALDENEEYCPVCVETMDEAKKKKPCKPSKGKRFAKRVDGVCRSHGQAGKAKDGTDRIQPGTEKAHAYCARSAGIKKCKNPPCANTLSRKKWKCQGKRSVV